MERNKVVYVHRKKTDGTVFYVGMGHVKRAYSLQRGKLWWKVANKHGYTVEIVAQGLTSDEAWDLEIELIKRYGRIDIGTGCLVNHTKGGNSIEEIPNSSLKKKKRKLKKVERTKEWSDKISAAMRGKKKTEEHKMKISERMKGKRISDATKEKMRLSNKSKIITAKPIACYDYYSKRFVAKFNSIVEASRHLHCKPTSISNNIHKRTNYFYSKKLNKKLICQVI